MSRLTTDVTSYREVLGPGMMYPIYFITLIIPALIGLFSISVPLAFLSLFPILVLPPFILFGQTGIYNLSLAVQKSLSDLSTMSQEIYSGIRIIKGYACEKKVLLRFSELCLTFQKLNLKWVILEGLFYPFINLVTRLVTIAMVVLAGFIILQAWSALSAADFVSFMWLQSFIFGPILMMGWVMPFYIKGQAAYSRLLEIYKEPNAVHDNPRGRTFMSPHADIIFNNLTFTYPTSDNVALAGINLKIPFGSFIGITGPIGSGKTTLIRLLARDYEIPRGAIYLGDIDIHDYTLETLRSEIAIVEQYPFLFAKSIAENVSLAREEASLQEIQSVSEIADLHETILRFPNQYLTLVGERGITLSGGQKQRLAIARALLLNKSILLLDDIFAAVDAATERKIFASLKQKFAGKTVLMITHRISALEKMDRVIYMMNGRIAEDGSPDQLLKQQGPYAALLELQKLL
jgi:ATP-binding cassette subfamily B protein